MSDWTNLEEIMQDLSVAQGYIVPATLEVHATVGPPALNIEEEESTERSYYESEGGGGGQFEKPDFKFIQQMLNMVKENDNNEDESPEASSDLDPLTPEFVPNRIQKKIKRNVALSSIITAKEAELSAKRPIPRNVIPVMFKRKSVSKTEDKREIVSPLQTLSPHKSQQYTPSTHANEYYMKYLEQSMLKEQLEEDIWIKAERQMKEIENRKKRRAEHSSPIDRGIIISLPDVACASDVYLTEHRHLKMEDCIVCIVAAKHGYYF